MASVGEFRVLIDLTDGIYNGSDSDSDSVGGVGEFPLLASALWMSLSSDTVNATKRLFCSYLTPLRGFVSPGWVLYTFTLGASHPSIEGTVHVWKLVSYFQRAL
jgi:hypothetical protein